MKSFSILLISFVLFSANAVAQFDNTTESQEFWQTNITPILDGDIAQVVSQTNFPLVTFEGEWSKEEFTDAYEILFDDAVLAELNSQSYTDIQSFEDSPGEMTYTVVLVTLTEDDGEVFESATILSFKKFDGKWKLYNIDMAG